MRVGDCVVNHLFARKALRDAASDFERLDPAWVDEGRLEGFVPARGRALVERLVECVALLETPAAKRADAFGVDPAIDRGAVRAVVEGVPQAG